MRENDERRKCSFDLAMAGGGGVTREVVEGLRGLDLNASPAALTQCCTLRDIVQIDSDPSRPWSLSSSPPDLRHKIEMALLRRRLSAVEVSEASESYSGASGEPSSSQTTPPDLIDTSTSTDILSAHDGKTTWHPNVGEWTWTRKTLRSIRCASFARSTSNGGAYRRRIKTEKRAMYATRERLEALQLLMIEYTLKKRLRAADDATYADDRSYVPVEMCGGSQLPSHAQPTPYQRPQHKRPLWDKSSL